VLALAENLPKIIDKTSLSANQDVEMTTTADR
jgi:hypothetical protein